MSIKQMQKVWEDTSLEPNKKLIMLSLCDNANDEGFCYPSIKTTCRKTGLSNKTVIKHQKELEDQNYLLSKKRNSKKTEHGGKRLSTIYIVFPNENIKLLDEELLTRFDLKKSQSEVVTPLGQSEVVTPLNGSQSEGVTPKPSLSLFNHHLYKQLTHKERELYMEYTALRKSLKLKTTLSIHERLLAKYFEFGRDTSVIEKAITSNWKDFYKPSQSFAKEEPRFG